MSGLNWPVPKLPVPGGLQSKRLEECRCRELQCGHSRAGACQLSSRPPATVHRLATCLRTINMKRLEAATSCTLRNVGLPSSGDVGVARSPIWHGVRGPDVAPPAACFHWLAQNQ